MFLYLLERDTQTTEYDVAYSFVVRAKGPKAARRFASKECGDEGAEVWLDPKRTTCRRLLKEGVEGVVIRDYNSAG